MKKHDAHILHHPSSTLFVSELCSRGDGSYVAYARMVSALQALHEAIQFAVDGRKFVLVSCGPPALQQRIKNGPGMDDSISM